LRIKDLDFFIIRFFFRFAFFLRFFRSFHQIFLYMDRWIMNRSFIEIDISGPAYNLIGIELDICISKNIICSRQIIIVP
jgi:hypothetical protein